jgi:hypothetical protein
MTLLSSTSAVKVLVTEHKELALFLKRPGLLGKVPMYDNILLKRKRCSPFEPALKRANK